MKKILTLSFFSFLWFSLSGFSWPFSFLFGKTENAESFGSRQWMDQEVKIIKAQAPNINEKVLRYSLTAYVKARQHGLDNKEILTVIDYSKPSTEQRLWVIDLRNQKTLFNTWVTHGKNSGALLPTSFSNENGSLKSSLGVFVTDSQPYVGGEGYSLRIHGLESGVNDHAYNRNVVVHGAWYADGAVAKQYGQLGRSWGCPAVSPKLIKPLINVIKQQTVIFAYYPDRQWLNHSSYLA